MFDKRFSCPEECKEDSADCSEHSLNGIDFLSPSGGGAKERSGELEEWVVSKIATCMDEGRVACEALKGRIEDLATVVATLQKSSSGPQPTEQSLRLSTDNAGTLDADHWEGPRLGLQLQQIEQFLAAGTLAPHSSPIVSI